MRRLPIAAMLLAGVFVAAAPRGARHGDLVLAGYAPSPLRTEICVYSRDGAPLSTLLQRPGYGGNKIAAAPDGTLYHLAPDGVLRRIAADGKTTDLATIGGAFTDIALGSGGDIYVAEVFAGDRGTLHRIGRDGEEVETWPLRAEAMDFADRCTLVYATTSTSFSGGDILHATTTIARFDICRGRELAPLFTYPMGHGPGSLPKLRVLRDGGILTAARGLERRTSSGQLRWERSDQMIRYSLLAFEPDGKTFWTGDNRTLQHLDLDGHRVGPDVQLPDGHGPFAAAIVGGWRASPMRY